MNNLDPILRHIQRGQLKPALEKLGAWVQANPTEDGEIDKLAIGLSARYHQLQRQKMSGLVPDGEAQIKENQITHSVLELIDRIREEVEEGGIPEQTGTPKEIVAQEKAAAKKTKILFFAADTMNQTQLQVHKEVREIEDALIDGDKGEQFELIIERAGTPDDFMQKLLRHRPEIVHFSGHGSREGIFMAEENGDAILVSRDSLASAFRLFREVVGCVVLNACVSLFQAKAIRKYVPAVVGTNANIADRSAITFSKMFYMALADGEDVTYAAEFAKVGANINNLQGDNFVML